MKPVRKRSLPPSWRGASELGESFLGPDFPLSTAWSSQWLLPKAPREEAMELVLYVLEKLQMDGSCCARECDGATRVRGVTGVTLAGKGELFLHGTDTGWARSGARTELRRYFSALLHTEDRKSQGARVLEHEPKVTWFGPRFPELPIHPQGQ